MLRTILAAVALVAFAPASALAEPAVGPAAAAVEQAKPPLEPGQERVKVRCREEVPSGTRFAKRTCRRLDDLARAEAEAADALARVSRMNTFTDTSGRTK